MLILLCKVGMMFPFIEMSHIKQEAGVRAGVGGEYKSTKLPFDFLPQDYTHINYQECTEMSIKSWFHLPPH